MAYLGRSVSFAGWFPATDIFWNLPKKAPPFLQAAPERLDKSIKALPVLYLRRRLRVIGQRWRNRQPEADKWKSHLKRLPSVHQLPRPPLLAIPYVESWASGQLMQTYAIRSLLLCSNQVLQYLLRAHNRCP